MSARGLHVEDARQLLAKLQRIPKYDIDLRVKLVQSGKSVFDRPGLKPNAVDCIDRAVDDAEKILKKEGYEESAYIRLLDTYNKFVTVVAVVERSNYWVDIKEASNPIESTAELLAIRQVFDRYVKAKLIQHGMPKYLERLRIPDFI